MKRHAYRVFATLSLLLALGLTTINAQSFDRLEVNVPFQFTAGGKTLPAGAYTIRQVDTRRLLIESVDGDQSALILINTVQAKRFTSKAKVIFNRYENSYFLSEVLGPGTEIWRQEPRSNAEARLAKTAAPPQVISVGNDRQ